MLPNYTALFSESMLHMRILLNEKCFDRLTFYRCLSQSFRNEPHRKPIPSDDQPTMDLTEVKRSRTTSAALSQIICNTFGVARESEIRINIKPATRLFENNTLTVTQFSVITVSHACLRSKLSCHMGWKPEQRERGSDPRVWSFSSVLYANYSVRIVSVASTRLRACVLCNDNANCVKPCYDD